MQIFHEIRLVLTKSYELIKDEVIEFFQKHLKLDLEINENSKIHHLFYSKMDLCMKMNVCK